MNVLVTGGAGYIGSVTTEKLIAEGNSVTVIDNLSTGHQKAIHPDAKFYELDLADHNKLKEVFKENKFDAVMHFASKTLVGESVENPCLYFRENVFNALNLIEECVKNNVNKFILSSTANLFDEPEVIPIKYNEKIVPGSPYGESKFMIERFLYWMDKIYDFKFTALRYFNACGASESRGEDHDPETHLIPLVLEVALGKREKISIFGDDYDTPDGTCVRDYIHILDLADAHILALKALDTNPSATYNLGNGKGFSVMEVIKTSEKITGEKINFDITDRRSGDPATLIADSNKIKEDLNWKPKYDSLESIIQTAWDWHRNNPKGYQK